MRKILILILLVSASLSLVCQDKPPEKPDGYFSNFTLKAAYFLGTLDLIEKMPPIPSDIIEFKDIIYNSYNNDSLKLDIYHKKEINTAKPLLIFIHGGAWKKGNKKDYRRYLIDFAQKGYVTATVQYTFSNIVKFPKQLDEIKSAIIWLKTNAQKYNIDKNKIALIGGSAGGHLSMMAGFTSSNPKKLVALKDTVTSNVQAIVNFYGPSDLTTEYAQKQKSVLNLIGKTYSEAPILYQNASPINFISDNSPPIIIFHGTLDELVPFEQSDNLVEKLKANGVPHEYHKLEGWPHTMDLSVEVNKYCQYYIDKFLEKHLWDN